MLGVVNFTVRLSKKFAKGFIRSSLHCRRCNNRHH